MKQEKCTDQEQKHIQQTIELAKEIIEPVTVLIDGRFHQVQLISDNAIAQTKELIEYWEAQL